MLQAIIFDVDGTLRQSIIERQEAWFMHWAQEHGREWTFESGEAFRKFYNKTISGTGLQGVYDALGLPGEINDHSHPVWEAYSEFCEGHPVKLYSGVEETVKKIWEKGSIEGTDPLNCRRVRLGINSSNTYKGIVQELRPILPYFDTVMTSDFLRRYHGTGKGGIMTKPATISLALLLDLLQSEGKATIHVGDTLDDLAASQNIVRHEPIPHVETLITVGACYGYQGREILEKGVEISSGRAHFDYLIDEPGELIAIVEERLKQ